MGSSPALPSLGAVSSSSQGPGGPERGISAALSRVLSWILSPDWVNSLPFGPEHRGRGGQWWLPIGSISLFIAPPSLGVGSRGQGVLVPGREGWAE